MSTEEGPGRRRRVPGIEDLRSTTQSAKTRADRRWSYRAFRFFSVYVTWALLHTRVTPNQVTVASLVIAGGGLVLVGMSALSLALWGCGLLVAYHLLDRVDGELARYQERYSLFGVYLDNTGHYLTHGGLFIAATFRLSETTPQPRVLWLLGSIGAIAAIMSRVEKHSAFHLFSQYVMERPGLVDSVRQSAGLLTRRAARAARSEEAPVHTGLAAGLATRVRDLVLVLSWFPVTVMILALGFTLESVSPLASAGEVALYTAVGTQLVAYAGVEVANLTGNLGAESRRLAGEAGLIEEDV